MRILVTGGAGFIGCNFVRHLLAEDPEAKVVNFDLLTYAGSLSNLQDLTRNDDTRLFKEISPTQAWLPGYWASMKSIP